METKTAKVLEHLKKFKTITSWEAIQLYKATRLSAIIFNLRKKHVIRAVLKKENDIWFAEYQYGGERNVEEE